MTTAPSVRAKGSEIGLSTSTPAFPVPAGVQANDILVIGFFLDDGRRSVSVAPSGFTIAGDIPQVTAVSGAPAHKLYVYYKRASGSESGTISCTIDNSTGVEGLMIAYKDVITTGSPWNGTPDGANSGTSNVTTAPAVSTTTDTDNCFAVYFATNWTSGAYTPPTGFTEDNDTGGNLTAAHKAVATHGAVSNAGASCSGSGRSCSWIGALLPIPDTGVTSTLTASLPAATAALVGAGTDQASLTASLPAITAALAGDTFEPAELDAVLPAMTAGLVGAGTATGAFDATLPALTGSLVGDELFAATLAASLASLTAVLVADETFPATLTAQLPALAGAFEGAGTDGAALAADLPAMGAQLIGGIPGTSTLTGVLPAITAAFGGEVGELDTAELAAVLPIMAGALSGGSVVTGVLDCMLPSIIAGMPPPPGVLTSYGAGAGLVSRRRPTGLTARLER